jgi:outer membrane protein assembly factor BamB
MKNSAIRHLAVSRLTTKLAAAFFESTVQIWNLSTLEKLAEFETALSFGGCRLALDPSGELCAAASWVGGKRGGVGCYEAKSGRLIWHRPDLKQTQRLRFSTDGKSAWCVPDAGPAKRLDSVNGRTLDTLTSLTDVYESPYSANLFLENRKRNYQLGRNSDIRIPRLKFAVLDASFSRDSLAISEVGGPVRCLESSTGTERWRYSPSVNNHFLRLWYREADDNFYGVQWDYQTGAYRALVRLGGKTGQSKEVCPLRSWREEYCIGLDSLVTSAGELIGLTDGRLIGRLPFPLKE